MNFRVERLCKLKSDGTFLFKDVSFSLNDREIVTITGPSGVGKTTLLKCIAQLSIYEEGKVYLDDRTPEEYGILNWRTNVMYVPQRTPILPGTPAEWHKKMISFGAQSSRFYKHVDPVDISQKWDINEELWDKEWNQLSGGEIQRISLATALSCKPDVLLLDEPTSALDPTTSLLVEESLREFACVVVTHNPEQQRRIATRTLRLEHNNQNVLVDML